MNKRVIYYTIIIMIVSAFQVQAQNAKINFVEKTHNFGDIEEKGGKAVHVFEFTNTGKSPLIIQRVTASCGCTTPEWTKTPIEPGNKGVVTVAYNPLGRPGKFTKSISVYSNASNELERLSITGNVINHRNNEKPQPVRNSYRISIDNLKLETKSINFNEVYKGENKSVIVKIMNASKENMTVKIIDLPNHISYTVSPKILRPNEEGSINFTLNSSDATEWGPISSFGYVMLNGKKNISDNYKLIFNANIAEDFSKMTTSEKRNAPIMEIKSPNLYMGKIKKGSKVRGRIDIKNVGVDRLEVRRIINENSDIILHPTRLSVKRRKTGSLRLDVDTKYLPKGNYKKRFTIITNDPINSMIVYTVDFSVI